MHLPCAAVEADVPSGALGVGEGGSTSRARASARGSQRSLFGLCHRLRRLLAGVLEPGGLARVGASPAGVRGWGVRWWAWVGNIHDFGPKRYPNCYPKKN